MHAYVFAMEFKSPLLKRLLIDKPSIVKSYRQNVLALSMPLLRHRKISNCSFQIMIATTKNQIFFNI